MNKVIEDILSRRTIRNYKPDQIKQEELDEILETGSRSGKTTFSRATGRIP